MPASGLPLVAMVTVPSFSTKLMVAVLPSLRYATVAPCGSVADPVRYTPEVIRSGSNVTASATKPNAARHSAVTSRAGTPGRRSAISRDNPSAIWMAAPPRMTPLTPIPGMSTWIVSSTPAMAPTVLAA